MEPDELTKSSPRFRGRVLRAAAFVLVTAFALAVHAVIRHEVVLGHGSVPDAFDEIALPPGITVYNETTRGRGCLLGDCPEITRSYTSTRPRFETFETFASELRRLGYECASACDGVNQSKQSSVDFSWPSLWTGKHPVQLSVLALDGYVSAVVTIEP